MNPALNLKAILAVTSRFTDRYGLRFTAGVKPEVSLGLNLAVTSEVNLSLSLGFRLGVKPTVEPGVDSGVILTTLLPMLRRAVSLRGR